MLIGNGLLASEFAEFAGVDDVVIFAAGVSNSESNEKSEFIREEELIKKVLQESSGLFVYFSTCSIYDPERNNSPYVQHKLQMESLVKNSNRDFIIFRLSNVVGRTKKGSTITNFFYDKIIRDETFLLWKNAYRNLIDIADIGNIVRLFIKNKDKYLNKIINVASPYQYNVLNILGIFEKILGKKAKYEPVDKGGRYNIEINEIHELLDASNDFYNESYLEDVIKKYISGQKS